MNELGEGDIDIIKAPIVIDNVSLLETNFCLGVWIDEGRNSWWVRTITRF